MSGKELIKLARRIKLDSHLTQKDIAEKYGITQQWVSKLVFISKSDDRTCRKLSSMTATAIKRIVDTTRSKTKGKTLKTKLNMMARFADDPTLLNPDKDRSSKAEKSLDKAMAQLAEAKLDAKLARIEAEGARQEMDELAHKFTKLSEHAIQLKLALHNALRGAGRPAKEKIDPNTIHMADVLRSRYGVKVIIQGTDIHFKCMKDEILSGVFEQLI